jgi:hypothetical protein
MNCIIQYGTASFPCLREPNLRVRNSPQVPRFRLYPRYCTQNLFRRQECPSNLLPSQKLTLESIRQRHDLIVWRSDKNLGPAIIERSVYIKRVLSDHLCTCAPVHRCTAAPVHLMDTSTYRHADVDELKPFKRLLQISSSVTFLRLHKASVMNQYTRYDRSLSVPS